MTLDAMIIFVGGAVAILPFLGFPSSWDSVFFFILGVIMVILGVAVRRNAHRTLAERRASRMKNDTFIESAPVETREEVHHDVA